MLKSTKLLEKVALVSALLFVTACAEDKEKIPIYIAINNNEICTEIGCISGADIVSAYCEQNYMFYENNKIECSTCGFKEIGIVDNKNIFEPICNDGCKEFETRCYENTAQICNSDSEWITFNDCNFAQNYSCEIPQEESESWCVKK